MHVALLGGLCGGVLAKLLLEPSWLGRAARRSGLRVRDSAARWVGGHHRSRKALREACGGALATLLLEPSRLGRAAWRSGLRVRDSASR